MFCTIDGACFMVMVGLAETYFAAFVLELKLGEVAAGLVLTVPLMLAAVVQLSTPAMVRWLGSYKRWTVLCASSQGLACFPLAAAALIGHAPLWVVFLLTMLYWSGAVMGGSAWASWMGVIIPSRVRSKYFAHRNHWLQVAALGGLVAGGLLLRGAAELNRRDAAVGGGSGHNWVLVTFAAMFTLAGFARLLSAWFMSRQSEPHDLRIDERDVGLVEWASRLHSSGDGRLLAYLLSMQFVRQFADPFWHPYVRGHLRFADDKYMALIAAGYVARILALSVVGKLAHAYGAKRALWIGGLMLVPASAMWIGAENFWWLLAAALFSGAATATYDLASFLMLLEATRSHERMSVISKFTVGQQFCGTGGSAIGGWLLGGMGHGTAAYQTLFTAAVGVRAATVLLLVRVKEHKPA
jgi:MFS family permease